MYIFFDTEFTGLHKDTTLISIGFVTENNKEFYAELTDYDRTQLEPWTNKNVLPNLLYDKYTTFTHIEKNNVHMKGNKYKLKDELTRWFSTLSKEKHIIVSDCLSYDWVLFNNIFGHAFNIPKNINYIPLDISTYLWAKGFNPNISREMFISNTNFYKITTEQKHNALYDAKTIKEVFFKLLYFH